MSATTATDDDVRYVFFYGHTNVKDPLRVLSQWYPSRFVGEDGKTEFNCAEQWMMYQKARLFKDEDAAARILAATSPKQQKQLGRKVKGFDAKTWSDKALDIVVRGTRLKFAQNADMRRVLLATGHDTQLVEASPTDAIWGIGLSAARARRTPAAQWPGMNLLGKALARVRDEFLSASSANTDAMDETTRSHLKRSAATAGLSVHPGGGDTTSSSSSKVARVDTASGS